MNNTQITYLDKVIHEINGYIHAISLTSDLMLDSRLEFCEENNRINLQHIRQAAEKLAGMVGVLSLATNLNTDRLSIKIEEFDLVQLVQREVKYYQVRNRTNHNLKIELKNKVQNCKVKADKLWLEQLLANLIMNAVNHARKGLIEVTVDIINKDGAEYFFLSVSDEGNGVPENELESIFKPLNSGTGSIGKTDGSGIGLAVARRVVEGLKGSITARNKPEVGAIFEVLLPLKG